VAGFRDKVDTVRRLIEREKEVSIAKLAYMIDVSPQRAAALLKAAAEVDSLISYRDGVARWMEGEKAVEQVQKLAKKKTVNNVKEG
jgi:Mn-dependent DtxR family transcriptional regulator